jgi:hypothetical protein
MGLTKQSSRLFVVVKLDLGEFLFFSLFVNHEF